MSNSKFRFAHALLPEGLVADALIEVDGAGFIVAAGPADPSERAPVVDGLAIPGIPNVHAHAHQRAMAGRAEVQGPGRDSFWTWRERMYANGLSMTPEDLEAIAAQSYVEMLKAGFTAVGEFQYLHHQPDGTPYDDPAEMTLRCLAAADATGIAITLLPVLYTYGGFGAKPPTERQRRFTNDTDSFLRLLSRLTAAPSGRADTVVGLAPHSLRAVGLDQVRAVLEGFGGPFHIHVAEQTAEVDDCIAFCGRRPVELLMDSVPVDNRWCLIHATHITPDETRQVAQSGAVVGLCPITEANLGDGVFVAGLYRQDGGRFGVGSDSNVEINAAGELRLLEYGQRLMHRQRNVLAGGSDTSTGETLLKGALAGGAQALGRPMGALAPGHRADIVVLDLDAPGFAGQPLEAALDCWIFGAADAVRDVYVAGRQVVRARHHPLEDAILARYREIVRRLNSR